MKEVTEKLDKVANRLEELGCYSDAAALDVISNTLEKMAAYNIKNDPAYKFLMKAADAIKAGRGSYCKGFLEQALMALNSKAQMSGQDNFKKAAQLVAQALKTVTSDPEAALGAVLESTRILDGSQSAVARPSGPNALGPAMDTAPGLIPGYQRYASKEQK